VVAHAQECHAEVVTYGPVAVLWGGGGVHCLSKRRNAGLGAHVKYDYRFVLVIMQLPVGHIGQVSWI